jgi:hypothetical protein
MEFKNVYETEYRHRGTSYFEVSVLDKDTMKNSHDRRIDIVRIRNDIYKWKRKYSEHKEDFYNNIASECNYEIELVEIKTKLNRAVIGQIMVGEYLFKKKFKASNVTKTILYHIGDEV